LQLVHVEILADIFHLSNCIGWEPEAVNKGLYSDSEEATSSMVGFLKKDAILLAIFIISSYSRISHSFIRQPSRGQFNTVRYTELPLKQRVSTSRLLSSRDDSAPELPTLSKLESETINAGSYVTVFGVLPVLSYFTFDALLLQITDFNLAAADRQIWIILLLLSKRLYIYALALTTLDLAAKRSVELPGSLGKVIYVSCIYFVFPFAPDRLDSRKIFHFD
jgi:hypothetical protein